jgi:hypothetical protein
LFVNWFHEYHTRNIFYPDVNLIFFENYSACPADRPYGEREMASLFFYNNISPTGKGE